jgi:hypothetical protein
VAWQPRYSEVAGASSTESRVRHQARINRRELTVAVGRRGRRKRGAARRRLTAVRVLRWPAVDVQLALVSWRWATGCGRGWSAAGAPRRPVPCEEVEADGGGVTPDSFVLKPERKRKREEGPTRAWERRKGGSGHNGPWRKEKGVGANVVRHSRPPDSGGCGSGDGACGSRG